MKNRKLATVLAGVMLASVLMTGCGKELDAAAVAATVDGEEISLGVANFAAKLQQAQTESYYMAFFGTGMWDQEISEGYTLEDSTKESVLSMIQELYVVKAHAEEKGVSLTEEEQQKIADAAAQFVADNSDKAISRMTASEEVVKEYLELMTIQKKVSDVIIKDVDTNVSDEEAAQKRLNYVNIPASTYTNEDGESVEYTEEEKAERRQIAEDILAEAKETGDFEAAINAKDFSMSSVTFGDDDGSMNSYLQEAAQALKEGEYTDVVESEYGYYVGYLESELDRDATDAKKEDIIAERESELYNSVYQEWADAAEFVVNEDVWAEVNFAGPLSVVSGEEE